MKTRRRGLFTLTLIATLTFAACMGGDDAPTATPAATPPPSSTTAEATSASDPAATTTSGATATSPAATATTESTTQPATATAEPAAATATPQAAATTPPALDLAPLDADLVAALQAGGHVVVVQVAASDDSGGNVEACMAQRPLADSDLARLRSIGVAFQQLGVPVGRIVSGASCAEVVAARVAFGSPGPLNDLNALLTGEAPQGLNTVAVMDIDASGAMPGVPGWEQADALILTIDGGVPTPVAHARADEWLPLATAITGVQLQRYHVPPGSHPHDVAPAADGGVWYTSQFTGELGWLDPVTGEIVLIPLGAGSAPHGVIVGPDDAAWITDSGMNAIVRVDPRSHEVTAYPLPDSARNANLNTAAFDGNGVLWFTGQNGYYGRLDPATGEMQAWPAPRGRGPYGIDATPDGDIYYASLAGSHIAQIDITTGEAIPIDPPTAGQGARRVWADSQGRVWVSEWNAGQVSVYDPASGAWRQWALPGDNPQTYAVYVDERDIVWLSDFGANAIVRFDPTTETFETFPLPGNPSMVRQILGRPHEVWFPESAADAILVLRTP